jgi:wobble nucleotide-excising tRNase
MLAAESRTKTGEVTTAARALNSHLPPGMKVEAYVALEAIDDIDQQIADQERAVAAISEAAAINARAALTEFPAPTLDAGFAGLLHRTLDDVARDAEQQLADHLASHGMTADGAEWIATGVEYARGEDCPFSGQNIRGLPVVAAFRSVFSDSYKNLKDDITRQRADIERQFGDATIARLDTVAAQNTAATEFWRQYCTFDLGLFAPPATVAPAARTLGAAALVLLDRKLGSPLDKIQPDDAYTDAVTAYEEPFQLLGATNQAIGQLNALIAAKKAETARADLRQAQAELARLKAVKARHTPEISRLCDDHTRVATEKTAIDIRKDAVRRQLDTHTKTVVEPYERRINASLQAFNAGFSIDKTTHAYPGGMATSSYQLIINSTAVDLGDSKTPASRPSFKNTLSAGDRTTLALAFFIADLERDQRLANKIVVFDDPFNSQDASTPPDRPRNHQARRPVRPGAGTVARRDVSQAAVGQGGTVSV